MLSQRVVSVFDLSITPWDSNLIFRELWAQPLAQMSHSIARLNSIGYNGNSP